MRKCGAAALIGALAAALAVSPAGWAKTFDVTRHGDHPPGACTHADCTFREGVIAANGTAAKDTIELPSRKPYDLSIPDGSPPDEEEGDVDVAAPLRIVHPGRGRATVDANQVGRVLEVYEDSPSELSRVTLRGGLTPDTQSGGGGGVLAYSDLELSSSRVVANAINPMAALGSPGGGISMQLDSDLTLRRSVVSGNTARVSGTTPNDSGGGISGSNGKISIIRTTIAGNKTDAQGGGVIGGDETVPITVRRSTIKGNTAAEGGGITILKNNPTVIAQSTIARNKALPTLDSPPNSGDGGGVLVTSDSGPVTIVNTTVANNRALLNGGGVNVDDPATVQMNAVTIARNRADSQSLTGGTGGGIYAATATPTVTLRNSLIALNRQGGGEVNECAGAESDSIGSQGGNLITTESMGGCPYFDRPTDLVRTNPRIGNLASNGGPTKTIALRKGSPAINHADGMSPKRDQRGVKRRNPDIGAFERR